MEVILKKRVYRLKEQTETQPGRGTRQWYMVRHNMLTASDVPTALGKNAYESPEELVRRKTRFIEASVGSFDWVVHRQPLVIDIYKQWKQTHHNENVIVYKLPLTTHYKYTWLGSGSINTTNLGKLLEIRNPKHRHISQHTPNYYWMLIQIKLEICNLEECESVECKFKEYKKPKHKSGLFSGTTVLKYPTKEDILLGTIESKEETIHWVVEEWSCTVIKRDRQWFKKCIEELKEFWKQVLYYRKEGIGKLIKDSKQQNNSIVKTQSLVFSDLDRQGRNWNEWVSATKTHNYLKEDTLIDWLEYYCPSSATHITNNIITNNRNDVTDLKSKSIMVQFRPQQFDRDGRVSLPNYQQFLCDQGIKFEEGIVNYLYQQYKNDIKTIADGSQARSREKYEETVQAMKDGIPILYQAVLHDEKHKTYGLPDLLIRSDYINKLFKNRVLSDHEITVGAPKLGTDSWHYRVIDIKLCTLHFRADGIHLTKQGSQSAYKAQIWIYNQAIGYIQGYTPNAAYLLGRRQKFQSCGVKYESCDPFDRLGIVDFEGIDAEYPQKAKEAVQWIRRVRTEGHKWSVLPPSIIELYPNMCKSMDGPWYRLKKHLAQQIKEITLMWNCGPKARAYAIKNGFDRWDDPKCCPETLGITGPKTKKVLQAILDINRNSSKLSAIIEPDIINCNFHRWQDPTPLEFYIDIETVNNLMGDFSVIPYSQPETSIFLIGIGWEDQTTHEWKYKKFVVESLTIYEERRILIEFHNFVTSGRRRNSIIRLFHWGHHEKSEFNKAIKRHCIEDVWGLNEHNSVMIDILKIMRAEPIVVKGAFNFGLKNISKAMFKYGLIKNYYSSNSKLSNGQGAMIAAWNCHNDALAKGVSMAELPLMKEIIKYNEMDCKLLWEIVGYLRKYHTKRGRHSTINELVDLNTSNHNSSRRGTKRKRKSDSPPNYYNYKNNKHKKVKIV